MEKRFRVYHQQMIRRRRVLKISSGGKMDVECVLLFNAVSSDIEPTNSRLWLLIITVIRRHL